MSVTTGTPPYLKKDLRTELRQSFILVFIRKKFSQLIFLII